MTLPRWLTPEILRQIVALDAQYASGRHTGHYEVRPHYQNGEPLFVDLDTMRVRFDVQKT